MPPLGLFSKQDYSGWTVWKLMLSRLEVGCVGVWVCGCVGVWVCGCVGMWVCGYVGVTSTSYKTEPCLKLELQRSNC